MVIRTGCLSLFLLLAARSATGMGAERGAAHQVVRQVWTFTALLLDAFAITAQTLIGYFVGMDSVGTARNVARVVTQWSLGVGVALTLAMLAGQSLIESWLVPSEAVAVFGAAWWLSAVFQPLNALCFITDGIHWGTADYRFLRNAMLLATVVGVLGIWFLWLLLTTRFPQVGEDAPFHLITWSQFLGVTGGNLVLLVCLATDGYHCRLSPPGLRRGHLLGITLAIAALAVVQWGVVYAYGPIQVS